MKRTNKCLSPLIATLALMGLSACAGGTGSSDAGQTQRGWEVNVLVGSALHDFCEQAAAQFNATNPELESGEAFYIACEAAGSGDVVSQVLSHAQQLQSGSLSPDEPGLPTLISVDGEIYHSQLLYQLQQVVPGQNYVPSIADAPLLAYSPMVFMAREDLAPSLQSVDDLFKALTTAETHQDLNAAGPPQKIFYVHTAPTRSNSGLQTLVAQFASVSGKRPEDLTAGDVSAHQAEIQQIQQKNHPLRHLHQLLSAINGEEWAVLGVGGVGVRVVGDRREYGPATGLSEIRGGVSPRHLHVKHAGHFAPGSLGG